MDKICFVNFWFLILIIFCIADICLKSKSVLSRIIITHPKFTRNYHSPEKPGIRFLNTIIMQFHLTGFRFFFFYVNQYHRSPYSRYHHAWSGSSHRAWTFPHGEQSGRFKSEEKAPPERCFFLYCLFCTSCSVQLFFCIPLPYFTPGETFCFPYI